MEKLNLETFRDLKQETIEIIKKIEEADNKGEELSEEELERSLGRYKEIIQTLSEHDLSDIDFEEWQGMFLAVAKELPLDLSKTKANLDFGMISYEGDRKYFPNFKGCTIKNFNFDEYPYNDEMFDEAYRKENAEKFLSSNVPEEVSKRFYEGKITLTDIKNNPELVDKFGEENIDWYLRDLYKLIGKEELCKLDAEFIDEINYDWQKLLGTNSNLKTADEIMPVLYENAREKILKYKNDDLGTRFYHKANELGESFKKLNPDLILADDVPEDIKNNYYNQTLSITKFSKNLEYFEGKKVTQALYSFNNTEKLIELYGDNIYQLFNDYKPMMDKMIDEFGNMQNFEIPDGPITEEQRKEIMQGLVSSYFSNIDRIEDFSMLKMVLDFVPLENLQFYNERATTLLRKYNIDDIINSGLDFKIFHSTDGYITDMEQIKKMTDVVEQKDLALLVSYMNFKRIEEYGVDKLIEYGIKDLNEISQPITDLQQIRELLEKRPIELINFGSESDRKIEFVKKYGIDNIIKLDEETKGMFSHETGNNDTYFTIMAVAEGKLPKLEPNETLTYEQFKDRMYKALLHTRDENGILTTGNYQNYDFIQGEFREEHPEIFIDDEVSDEVKNEFYTRKMTAETVRRNPEIIHLLQGKDLGRTFSKDMIAGMSLVRKDKDGNIIGGIPNRVNMAQYVSDKLGKSEFLTICAEYGSLLDKVALSTGREITPENIREAIEQSIYKNIKSGMEYFEFLPSTFQEKHPELFLPKDIDEDLRKKFYEGSLSFEDVRKNPQIKDLLLAKDISVGFGKTKYGQTSSKKGEQRKALPMWEVLSEQEIMDFAEKYGKYFSDVDQNIFKEGQNLEDRESLINNDIATNIINRKSSYDESVPEFFKQSHPELFLDENAPEELKKSFYDNQASSTTSYVNVNTEDKDIDFEMIKAHPEWRKFLEGKELSRAFSRDYGELFKNFDNSTLMKLGTRNPQTIQKMVANHREETLANWYKSTGGKFVPHHIVMLNFPEGEIDSFLSNSKKWSQLMKIDRYNLNDEGKSAILKSAYAMGVFQGNDDGFNKTVELFTQIPRNLSQEEYDNVVKFISENPFDEINESKVKPETIFEPNLEPLQEAYVKNSDGTYVLRINQQQEKEKIRELRSLLERAGYPKILTPEKAHQLFDSFAMEYNPDFIKLFNNNIEQILSSAELIKDVSVIQRQFDDIVRTNAGRRLTLNVAQDYIRSIAYENIEVGNEGVAEQAKIVGYPQKDFEAIQRLYNEGEIRDFSSIPRIMGKEDGYTYEMLRCDDPLALTIGTLTDCCQEINGAGQTSMEHSVVSPDGRVFCVRDNQGRLVAQSWFWRNQYTGCFDNIEIPKKIFELYAKEHPEQGKKGLTHDVLGVYKKAAQELMQEDEKVYKELLDEGTITQEQYDSLLLGKVTIGLGYNDIAEAIKSDTTIHLDSRPMQVKKTKRLPDPYTDAAEQYTIAERDNIVKASQQQENLYVYQDTIPEYDESNMSATTLLTMQRMEKSNNDDNLLYLDYEKENENLTKSQKIMRSLARTYGLNPEDTKVLATARIAMVYSKSKDKIKVGDVFSSHIKSDLTDEQHKRADDHIKYQMKKALTQIGTKDMEVDLSSLSKNKRELVEGIIQQIEKENDERGEK